MFTQEKSKMKRLNRLPTILFPVSVILTLSACAQQGEIKEPFEIRKSLSSSDYQGEIHPFKEPVVLERLSYELASTTTQRKNNKADIPTVSTMEIMSASGRIEYSEEQTVAVDFQALRFESKSSASPSTLWRGKLKLSFVMDLSNYSYIHKNYPLVGSTPEEQDNVKKVLDVFFDKFRELLELGEAYIGLPISDENNEFVFKYPISIPEFGIERNLTTNITFVGTTTYLNYDAIVMDMSGTITGNDNVHGQIEGYAVLSARDGATLFSRLVSRGYQGSEHGRLLTEVEQSIVADRYQPLRSVEESLDVAFRAYQKTDGVSKDKVFIRNEGGAWAFEARESFYSAWRAALKDCHRRSKDYGQPGECRVYAAGEDIVWDMSKSERDAVIKAYSE
jgi:hypothetical protein